MEKSIEHIFRAYDIRGVYNEDMTPENAMAIGRAFGTFLREGKVVVGRDARKTGEVLQCAFVSGLASAGIGVVDIGMVPTPVVSYYIKKAGAKCGVIISASHNPPEYNGIRFKDHDGTGYVSCIPKVKDIFLKKEFKRREWDELGSIKYIGRVDPIKSYLSALKSKVKLDKPIKVVIDPGNGSGCGVGAELFRDVGCKVVSINDEVDGSFPGRGPQPDEKSLQGLAKKVLEEKADLGIAYDGDADRAAFVDEEGVVRSAEDTGMVLAEEILGKQKGKVALNVECSKAVENRIKELGGDVTRIRVGDVFLADAVKKGALFAMESSSHFVVPELFPFDDGIAVSLYMAGIVSRHPEGLAGMLKNVKKYPVMKEKFKCPDADKFKVIDRITAEFKKTNDVDTIDGAKVQFEKGWALLRASNTQPIVRLTVEAENEDEVKNIAQTMEDSFKKNLK